MKLELRELLDAEDLDLGTSGWVQIDQERIDQFAEATGDHQWIHTDVERAAASDFGGTIAHGFLLVSLLPKLFSDTVEFVDMERMINFGIDKVRFLRPVPAGAEVRLKVKIRSARKRSGGILMRVYGELFESTSGRRAVVTEILFLAFSKNTED